ncbi:MAG: hypothetical protein PW845_02380 [Pseudomonas sp.]|uniref:hypothetical protein n=1 Tax=Pseudomonas abieticivorans TaxID=2931382 RepID=UPI0020BDC10F|nr:hypothetical protein [Pseudomonas sp. PIA16]MDE1164241.1 hypothetical protein [Pseudomonas sp.]
MKGIWIVIATVILSGCAATVSKHTIRGVQNLHINCSGLTSSWGKCYEKAQQKCGAAGYNVVTQSSKYKDTETDQYPFGFNPAGFSSRSLIVICK